MRCLEGFAGTTSALFLLSRGSLLGWEILWINTGERDIMLVLKCLMHSQIHKGFRWRQYICKAMFGKGFVNGIPVLLAKPLTYTNLSGESAEECDLSFSWKWGVSLVKDRYWKTTWSDGSQSIHASKV